MQVDQIIIFALVYLGGIALNKWPDFKNEGLPRMAWILSILGQSVTQLMGVGTAHSVTPAYAVVFASGGMPADAAVATAGMTASVVMGTQVWMATQVTHLIVEKLFPFLMRKVFKG